VIRRPGGNFDAVVVQSSPLDQFPEAKGLLTGRPIYTVYVSVNTAKDWALYFCIPGEKADASGAPVVRLGKAVPVQAPYPFTVVRPSIKVPAFFKTLLVYGMIDGEGRVQKLKVVRPATPEIDRLLLASLSAWEFRAATRDGVKVAVEFLVSIPVAGI
jgi:hypothetical protein